MLECINKLKCFIASAIACLALPSAGFATQVMPTPGFNLGNTLESTWGYAPPTQALINSIADAGFKTLRVPCAWDFNSTNDTINAAYMTEVANVVDWALARGMYVIINDHWDGGWFDDDFAAYDSNLNSKLLNIWSQVANRFKDYDSERLSFACANEPVVYSQTQNDVLYQYYQNWITAMRATGGGNAVRWLVVQAGSPWDWNILLTYGLNMPTDPAGKLMIEEHTYDPGEFTTTDSDQGRYMRYFWGSGYHVTGTQASRNCTSMEEIYLHEQFTRLKTNFADRGYPVLIGEWAGQPKPTSVTALTGQYRDQNFRSMTYYNKYMENIISSFGFSGTFFTGQDDLFHSTTGAVLNQDKLNSILGVSALPPLPGLAEGTGALQTLLLFNEAGGTTAADSTLSGRHGTLVGGPTRVTGKGGNAVDLDGTDDHVSLPISAVSSLADFTISTWVNLDAASSWSRIFDFGSGTTNYMFLTPANGATGTVRFAITTTGGGGEQQINGTAALPTGVWTHVAVTLSGNLGILYVNGVEVGRNAALTLTPASLGVTTQNWIGRSQYPDPYLNGRVDDFRIYVNALPASDVLALFNGTAGALAGPWASQDIGSPSIPGNSGSLGDDLYVTASGSDIWGGSDQFHYVSRTWTGDGTLTARVNGVTVTNTWIKAGLMFRESLDANARNVLIATLPGNTDISFQSRSSTGGGTAGINIDVPATPPAGPYWLKLQRVGNVFTAYHSADGVTWSQTAAPVTLSLPTTCYVGFAASANNNTLLTAAQFDHISLNASAPATPTGLTATAGNAEIVLNWSAGSDATSYTVKRATVSGGPYTTIANVATTGFTDTAPVSGTIYYYVVAANNVYGVSPDSTEASAIPISKWTGVVIGSSGSWGSGNTIASVFDGNLATYYDALNGTGDWAGLDLGSGVAAIVKQIKYCPRPGWASRMVGGQFQGSNVADFSSGVTTLFTVASAPPEGTMTVQAVTNPSSFRYLRYIGPANAFCNVAEVEFDGHPAVPSVPTNLVVAPGNAQVALTWNTASDAASYNVKRATVSGGPYSTIANVTGTGYTNTGLSNGTTYYYVVSAVNAGGESANSAQTSATPQVPAPPAPAGLVATGGDAQVALTWNASSGAASYNVKRATVSGGPYSTITNITGTSFTDTGLTNGATYYYVVSALNAAGESGNSDQASATPSASLPSPWATADIGAVAATGSASASGGTFTVTGSGADIWGTADEFRYVHQPSSGTCEMRAQVTSVQNTDPWAKAGVMIRESTAAGARYAAVFISPGNGVTFQRRTTTGGTTVNTVVTGVTAPRYVRLQRASNNSFRAYYSSNGTSWTQIGANQNITMASSATMGLAVTSHNDGTLCTSTISNVTATP
jgi:aryl-phospho-beta-D-glucosidase BglC (GH1 family)/fibronectin type 3 domain-containing protein